MAKYGFLKDPVAPPPAKTRILGVTSADCYLFSRQVGLFEPLVELGEDVTEGQAAGVIHTPETPWEPSTTLTFKTHGTLICKRIPGRVERGDCLFHVGQDIEI